MSIVANEEEMPNCFRFFPTGLVCIHFYFFLFMSIALVTVSVGALLAGILRDDPDVQCVFTTILTTVVAFWLTPPRMDAG